MRFNIAVTVLCLQCSVVATDIDCQSGCRVQGRMFLHLRGGRSGRLLMKLRVHEYFCNRVRYCFFVWVWVFYSHFCPFSVQRKPAKASLCNKGQRSDWDQRQRPWDFKVKEADVIGRRAGSERWSAMCHLLVDWTPTAACVMREKNRQRSRRHEMALRLFPLWVETSEAAAVCNILTPCWKHTLSLLPWFVFFFHF